VYFARAFAKDGDYMLLMAVEMMINSTPQCSAAGNSLFDTHRRIKIFQNFMQNIVINKAEKKIGGNNELN
jgi:hypothetical protein